LGYGSAGTIISTAADDKVRGIAAVISKAAGEKESAVSVIGMNPAAMVKLPEKMRRILSDEGIAVKDITIQNRVATAVVDAADEQRAVGYLHIKLI
jgi:aspartokinase